MDIGSIIEAHPLVIIGGILVLGVTFAYLAWHFLFLGMLPTKKMLEAKLSQKPVFYTPELGFTLADGGEELEGKKEAEDEKERVS